MKLSSQAIIKLADRFVNTIKTHEKQDFCAIFSLPKEFESYDNLLNSYMLKFQSEDIRYKILYSNSEGNMIIYIII